MMTGHDALRALVAGLVLSMTAAVWAAPPREAASPGAAGQKVAQKSVQKAAARGRADAPREIDGAMQPTATLGPGGKVGKAGKAEATGAAEPRMARIPGMTRFRSVGTEDAVLYDAPSDKARRIYQAPRGMPVEVISVLQAWVKVRDMLGDVAWIHRDDLADRRTVIATTTVALYKEPYETAARWFEAARGVIFDLQDEQPDGEGFVRVHHADGQTGFVEIGQVWGL